MKEIVGNLWNYHDAGNVVCITTNGITKNNGEAVMGRGCAREAKERFPELPRLLGERLDERGNECFYFTDFRIITFPTKYHWKNPSDIHLIQCSWADMLVVLDVCTIPLVYLPRPGCANGGLEWEDVRGVLIPPDDRVVIISRD